MKAKKVVSTILGLLFVVIVICGVFVGTYVFSKPSQLKDTASRVLILGYWSDEEKDIRLIFDQSGEFTICKDSDESVTYATGYFKVNEIDKTAGKIKLLVMPNDQRDESYEMGEKMKFFTEITFRNIDDKTPDFDKGWTFMSTKQREEVMKAECTAMFIMNDANETVYNCKRTRTVKEFNGDEHAEERTKS